MRPTLRCLVLVLIGVPLSLVAVSIDAGLWPLWLCYLLALVALGGLDVALGVPARRLQVQVTAPELLYIGERGRAQVVLTAPRARGPVRARLLPELDSDLAPVGELEVVLAPSPAGAHGEAAVELRPLRRGSPALLAVHVRWLGPFGLVERRRAYLVDHAVSVVPNVGAVRALALRMFADRSFWAGMKVERFLGDGSEFESLREYVPGLDHRAIDWKSSARHRKLLCQEFRAERNHQVVLAVDAGQLMREPIAGVPKLDHAINAALLLAWFCLRTGDRVGVAAFDERMRSWTEPSGGMDTFRRVQAKSAEIEYRTVETNYTLALAELSARLRRRSLVVVFTDFLDSVTAELMIENIGRLIRRHLVLLVAVRDPSLEERALAAPETLGGLHEAVVAADFARERALVLERLRRLGAHCLDVAPAEFSMAVVNRYLDLKRRELF